MREGSLDLTVSGFTLWRQISQAISDEIDEGILVPGERLPASPALAARFGVNRHTVLKAISHLQQEGLLRTERGGGIYVEKAIPYRMGARTRFEENLMDLNKTPERKVLSVFELPAPSDVAHALDIGRGESVVLVTLIGTADEIPISYNQNYFPAERLPGIADVFKSLSHKNGTNLATKAILESHGVRDFRRAAVRIRGRACNGNEARHLQMSPNEMVFEVEVTNVDADGLPIVFGLTTFCLNRVEFIVEMDGDLDR